jgi:hypothetical protein
VRVQCAASARRLITAMGRTRVRSFPGPSSTGVSHRTGG